MSPVTLPVLCEGPTESNFVTLVLAPYLRQFSIFAKPEPLRRGQYGIVDWTRLRKAIKADVGRSRAHEFVTTMIDLYNIGQFPGNKARKAESPYDRAKRIEEGMFAQMPGGRFIPYVQVHEFEALVLVDTSLLPGQFPDGEADDAPAILAQSIGAAPPEMVNDGVNTAPSKRIMQAISNDAYRYMKPTVGPTITAQIGIERLRQACPHFGEWVSRLESLAKIEG